MYKPTEKRERQAAGGKAGAVSHAGGGSLLDLAPSDQPQVASYTQPRVITPRPSAVQSQEPAQRDDDHRPVATGGGMMDRLSRIGIEEGLTWLRRGIVWIVLLALLGMGAAYGYSKLATPRFTAYTDMVIDPTNLQVVQDDVFANSPLRDTQLLEVESKLRVLTSRNVLTRVVNELKLTDDPEFVGPTPMALFLERFGITSDDGKIEDKQLLALRALSERVDARREERSFVVSVGVWSDEPEKSVRISEAMVAAFQDEVFQSSKESASRVASSLTDRLDELRANVREAEDKVESFRREHGLAGTSGGELMATRVTTELNIQVLNAQQRLIQAETRYNDVQAAVQQGNAVNASTLQSPALTAMRAEHSTVQQQIASLSNSLGARHPRIVALRSQLAIVQQSINDEARRILAAAKADMDQARSTLEALRARADTQNADLFTDNEAQVQLRELEREARAKGALYESYLTRAQQVAERQQLDTSNIKVISRAVPPEKRSWPPRTVVLIAGGAVGGIALGVGLALMVGFIGYMRRPETAPAR